MSSIPELKEMCLKIVGDWYNVTTDQQLTFSLNDKLLKETDVVITSNGKSITTKYGVALMAISELHEKDRFYIDIGTFDKTFYEIIELTKDKLVLNKFFKIIGVPSATHNLTYTRKIDTSFVNDILKGLD